MPAVGFEILGFVVDSACCGADTVRVEPAQCKIGVDGGGTKTELILVTADGRVLAQHQTTGCNPSLIGPERAKDLLLGALAALRESASEPHTVSHTLLCMAGAPAFWQETATALTDLGQVSVATDALPVLELATKGQPGLVLHCGTGSFVCARDVEGHVHYAGGLGWRLGDPGSGVDIGRRAVTLAMLELQGWSVVGALGEAWRRHAGSPQSTANELSRFLYNTPEPNAVLARFAPEVLELAASGCAPARQALHESLSALVEQARLVTTKLFPCRRVPCGLSGAILQHPAARAMWPEVLVLADWQVELRAVTDPPIEGVRRLLVSHA